MNKGNNLENPAQKAASKALKEVYDCLDARKSFLLEAGAGAGKTYSLIKALHYLIENEHTEMLKKSQKIACITYTNVAKDEIIRRTDRHPLIFCDTSHAFGWSLIKKFQKKLRELIPELNGWNKSKWKERILNNGGIEKCSVEYNLGHRSVKPDKVTLNHDDVLPLMIKLMDYPKFRRLMILSYPIILIDEYQDTNKEWIEAIKKYFLGKEESPLFGFFGDHWQKIYGHGCGKLEHESVSEIGKTANFRSVKVIVDSLNKMRPELAQQIEDPSKPGEIKIFHTDNYEGERLTSTHWKDDLPEESERKAFNYVAGILKKEGWDIPADGTPTEKTKILMLTHRGLAKKLGYQGIARILPRAEDFSKKENPYIEYFIDTLEPVRQAYKNGNIGEMFRILGGRAKFSNYHDKKNWVDSLKLLNELCETGSIGDVIEHLRKTQRPRLSEKVETQKSDLEDAIKRKEEQNLTQEKESLVKKLATLKELHNLPYKEVEALSIYHREHSPFETQHGVKGREFEDVFVVIGRGWNQYNFKDMLIDSKEVEKIPANKREAYERNRNLFYVVCSRPKQRLAILFTQNLEKDAREMLATWFGADNIKAIPASEM